MAWVSPSTVATGDVLTASKWNQDVVDNWLALGGAWTSWTPSWTNLTVGNGTVSAKYIAAGKLIIGRLALTWGSTTSASGAVSVSLPATASSEYVTDKVFFGNVRLEDAGVTSTAGYFRLRTTTTVDIVAMNAASTYINFAAVSNTVPWTWGTGDNMHAQFMYEAA